MGLVQTQHRNKNLDDSSEQLIDDQNEGSREKLDRVRVRERNREGEREK